ncbi:hypothetical protein DITRI_Ditri08aG0159200 [Diplodiscus trichospermus]
MAASKGLGGVEGVRVNGRLLADDIPPEVVAIKKEMKNLVVGDGIVECPDSDVCISKYERTGDGDLRGCFYTASIRNGLRFPLPKFFVEILKDFNVAASQLTPNSWRIIATCYICCRQNNIEVSSKLFRTLYHIRSNTGSGWYFLKPNVCCTVDDLVSSSNLKKWKEKFVWVKRSHFERGLQFRLARMGNLTKISLTEAERTLRKAICDCNFRASVLEDETNFTRYWPGPLEGVEGPRCRVGGSSSSHSEAESEDCDPLSDDIDETCELIRAGVEIVEQSQLGTEEGDMVAVEALPEIGRKQAEEKRKKAVDDVEALSKFDSLKQESERALNALRAELETKLSAEQSLGEAKETELKNIRDEFSAFKMEVEKERKAKETELKNIRDEFSAFKMEVEEERKATKNSFLSIAMRVEEAYKKSFISIIKEKYPSLGFRDLDLYSDRGFKTPDLNKDDPSTGKEIERPTD